MTKTTPTKFRAIAGFNAELIREQKKLLRDLHRQNPYCPTLEYYQLLHELDRNRETARAAHLIQGWLRGRKFTQVERTRYTNPSWELMMRDPALYSQQCERYMRQQSAIKLAASMLSDEFERDNFNQWTESDDQQLYFRRHRRTASAREESVVSTES